MDSVNWSSREELQTDSLCARAAVMMGLIMSAWAPQNRESVRCQLMEGSLFSIVHLFGGRSLKGSCNIRVHVPVCACSCARPSSPLRTPPILWGRTAESPPTPRHDPSPALHPYPQAIAWPTLGKNYPLKRSAWFWSSKSGNNGLSDRNQGWNFQRSAVMLTDGS